MSVASKQGNSPIDSGARELGQHGLRRIWAERDSLTHSSAWGTLQHHFQRACGGLMTSALTSLVSIITIGLALFVLAAVIFVMENLGSVTRGVESSLSMHLYLREGISTGEAGVIMDDIGNISGVGSVSYIGPDAALRELERSLGEEAVLLEGLSTDNPLPASIEVVFSSPEQAQQVYEQVETKYSQHSAFEYIQYSRSVVEEVARNLQRVKRGAVLGLGLVLLMTVFIISNTIQLALYSRRQEIEIMRLVGATDDFIRMPFLIEGFIQGLCGAICAVVFLYFVQAGIEEFAARVQFLKFLDFETTFLSLQSVGLVLFVGIIVGIAGSYYAVRRFTSA